MNESSTFTDVLNCEHLAQKYAELVKDQLPPQNESESRDYSKTQEITKNLEIRLKFQKVYTQIINLCHLKLDDTKKYKKLIYD